LASEIERSGRRALALYADVGREADIVRLFSDVDRLFEGLRLVGLVNSAGVGNPSGNVSSFTEASLSALWATNITGTILASREAVKRFAAHSSGGSIVNVSSMAATIGGRPGASAYAASKAAVDAFTVGLAKEVAIHGIRVNAVRPGLTRTAMTKAVTDDPARLEAAVATIPIHRVATADEVAKPILWLLSDEASFISGARLDISGGGFVIRGVFPHESE
jgi:NAD(P)-dependent dehydrogenase (short-subunit alcohol dehydrogenase family)